MRINFSPQRRDEVLESISKAGEALTITFDDIASVIDLSVIPEGATYADASEIHPALEGKITRIDGVLELTIVLPYPSWPQPEAVRFPAPVINPGDGEIALPQIAAEPAAPEISEVAEIPPEPPQEPGR